jgi:hypothetical protein
MSPSVPGQKDHVASGERAGKKGVGRRTEGSVDLHPFLVCEAFDMIEAAASDNANKMLSHAGFIAGKRRLENRKLAATGKNF